MPDVTITLTANQASRAGAALGAADLAQLTAKIKAILKERVKAFEATSARETSYNNAVAQVDADFSGF